MMEAGEGRGEAKTDPPGNFIKELLTLAAAHGLLPAHNLCSTAHLQRLPAPGFHRAASALQREIPFRESEREESFGSRNSRSQALELQRSCTSLCLP